MRVGSVRGHFSNGTRCRGSRCWEAVDLGFPDGGFAEPIDLLPPLDGVRLQRHGQVPHATARHDTTPRTPTPYPGAIDQDPGLAAQGRAPRRPDSMCTTAHAGHSGHSSVPGPAGRRGPVAILTPRTRRAEQIPGPEGGSRPGSCFDGRVRPAARRSAARLIAGDRSNERTYGENYRSRKNTGRRAGDNGAADGHGVRTRLQRGLQNSGRQ